MELGSRPETSDHLRSIVIDLDDEASFQCGYCSSPEAFSASHVLQFERLSPYDYQLLMDRGFRRDGIFAYRRILALSCCSTYTIRNNAPLFILSASQRRVVKKLFRFLDGTWTLPTSISCSTAPSSVQAPADRLENEADVLPPAPTPTNDSRSSPHSRARPGLGKKRAWRIERARQKALARAAVSCDCTGPST